MELADTRSTHSSTDALPVVFSVAVASRIEPDGWMVKRATIRPPQRRARSQLTLIAALDRRPTEAELPHHADRIERALTRQIRAIRLRGTTMTRPLLGAASTVGGAGLGPYRPLDLLARL